MERCEELCSNFRIPSSMLSIHPKKPKKWIFSSQLELVALARSMVDRM